MSALLESKRPSGQPTRPPRAQKQTFRRLLDMIDGVLGKVLKLAGYDYETSPPKTPVFGSGCCDAPKPFACRFGRRLSNAPGQDRRRLRCRRRCRYRRAAHRAMAV